MSKGDSVTVVVDLGGVTQEHQFVATKNGREFEVTIKQGSLIVTEQTMRGGRVVRTARFMASRVVSCIEEPIEEEETVTIGVEEPTRLPMMDGPGLVAPMDPADGGTRLERG